MLSQLGKLLNCKTKEIFQKTKKISSIQNSQKLPQLHKSLSLSLEKFWESKLCLKYKKDTISFCPNKITNIFEHLFENWSETLGKD